MAGKRRLSDDERREHEIENRRRFRKKHHRKINAYKKLYRAESSGKARNAGQEWSSADLSIISADDRPRDRVLAKMLGRSITAIQVQRNRNQYLQP